MEYNMTNIIFEKSYTKLFLDSFLNNQKLLYFWINNLQFVFIECQVEDYQNKLKLS